MNRPVPLRWAAAPLTLALTTSAPGCRCEREAPYTPFGVASALPEASPASAVPPPSAAPSASGFAPARVHRAPEGSTRFSADGFTFNAPGGQRIQLALSSDFDGDQAKDVVAWTVPREGAGGELWFYPAAGAPRRAHALPSFVPTDGCKLVPSLEHTGPRTVTVDVSAACRGSFVDRAPLRSVSVVAPAASRPLLAALRLASPAPGEAIEVSVDSSDRDGDGRDDVRAVVRMRAEGRTAGAVLSWLDRAAGPSRDPREPADSLAALGAAELPRSNSKKHAGAVVQTVRAARRLVASLCAEGGTPRVFDAEGTPFSCGRLDRLVDDLALAELQAALARGDVVEASGVLERDGWFVHASGKGRREVMRKGLTKALVAVEGIRVRALETRPPPRKAARWSPLWFEQPEPTLLVNTESGLVRVTADGASERPVETSEGVPRWPLPLELGAGRVASGASHACGRSELVLREQGPGGEVRDTPLEGLLSARPGPCTGRAMPEIPLVPLGVSEQGLSAIVAGVRVGPDVTQPGPGKPLSPDGKHRVVATQVGLLVTGGEKAELWLPPEVAPAALSDCAVSNGARALACVAEGRVLLLLRSE